MRTIIAGGRGYQFSSHDFEKLTRLSIHHRFTEIVSGGARGADSEGERFAKMTDLPVKRFPAQWEVFGKKAGMLRNIEMAEYAEALVIFPGGRGSAHMLKTARNKGLKIFNLSRIEDKASDRSKILAK